MSHHARKHARGRECWELEEVLQSLNRDKEEQELSPRAAFAKKKAAEEAEGCTQIKETLEERFARMYEEAIKQDDLVEAEKNTSTGLFVDTEDGPIKVIKKEKDVFVRDAKYWKTVEVLGSGVDVLIGIRELISQIF